jgi:ABC-type multidrug transport system fused ATPase/permease subunit
MEKPKELIEKLSEKGEDYGKTTLELMKLKTIDKSADMFSNLVSWLIVILIAILFFTLLNIAIALWLGGIMGQSSYGFFTVSGFYAFLTLVFLIFRKQLIKKPVNNSIVKQLLD